MEKISTLLALCKGNPPATDEFRHKSPAMRFLKYFVILDKLFNKQPSVDYSRRCYVHVKLL